MSDMIPSHAANLISAQVRGVTLCKAMRMLEEAHRFVGQSNSIRAMDLSAQIKELIAEYRQAVGADNSPKT